MPPNSYILRGPNSLGVFMGLREWLLKPYQVLQEEVKSLKAEVKNLAKDYQDMLKELLKIQKALETKADKKTMERELESLSKLVMTVYDKLKV